MKDQKFDSTVLSAPRAVIEAANEELLADCDRYITRITELNHLIRAEEVKLFACLERQKELCTALGSDVAG